MTQRIRYLLATVTAAGLFGLAACSSPAPAASSTPDSMPGMVPGQSMPGTMTMSAGGPPSSHTDSNAAPTATDTVSITNFAFSPGTITVKAGTTVVWTNKDQDAHTVTATSHAFGSQPLNTGDTFRHAFASPGTYSYLCTIHPFMTATVVVTP